MQWKNGRGTTQQIAISPADAQFPSDSFLWRLSAARVQAKDQFSLFPGYRRWIVVWKGQGLSLNGRLLPPFEMFRFDGDEAIECDLVDGTVVDLGLIYDPKQLSATTTMLQITSTEQQEVLNTESLPLFLFCALGTVSIGAETLEEGDTLQLNPGEKQTVSARRPAKLFLIQLKAC